MLTIMLGAAIAGGVMLLLTGVRVLQEYERAVVFRFGRARTQLATPGVNLLLQLASTTLRAVLGKMDLDDILAHRDAINGEVRGILDTRTEQWGVEISAVEIKDIQLPKEMQRAMARQAEAERERRAKVIAAEGEVQAASKLAQAAEMISAHPGALQLRLYQTLVEVSGEASSTFVFPVPIDFNAGNAPSPAQTQTTMQSAVALAASQQAQKQLAAAVRGEGLEDPAKASEGGRVTIGVPR